MDLVEGDALESQDSHWYYRSKARVVAKHVGRCTSLLDVGAGTGFFSRRLLSEGLADRAVCVDTGYSEERDEMVAGRPISFRRSIASTDADVILMMDVLEHVDDDVGLLRSYLALARTGARLLITVPAFQFLWSAHDEFLGHCRRYTLAGLRDTVVNAGAREISAHYYFAGVLPIAAPVRLLRRGRSAEKSDMRPAGPVLNAILGGLCSAEQAVMRWNRVAGLSVVMSCRR